MVCEPVAMQPTTINHWDAVTRLPMASVGNTPRSPLRQTQTPRCDDSVKSIKMPSHRALSARDFSEASSTKFDIPRKKEGNWMLPEKRQREKELSQHRSVCSEIIPRQLFLSGYMIASNRRELHAHGITHIINAAGDVCASSFEGEFTYLTYYLKDTKEEDITAMFYRTFSFIDDAIQSNGRVLIHCREGVSRSSTLTAAYMMYRYQVDANAALNMIREVRAICNPNTGFYCQLFSLQKRLEIDGKENGSPPDTKLCASRVSRHDPRNPCLILRNFDYNRKVDVIPYDSRFGFMLRVGSTILGWIGQDCPNKDEVRASIEQHAHWVQKYEGVDVDLDVFSQGDEPEQFWDWNRVERPGPVGFIRPRAEFDSEYSSIATPLADVPPGFENRHKYDAFVGQEYRPPATPRLPTSGDLEAFTPEFDALTPSTPSSATPEVEGTPRSPESAYTPVTPDFPIWQSDQDDAAAQLSGALSLSLSALQHAREAPTSEITLEDKAVQVERSALTVDIVTLQAQVQDTLQKLLSLQTHSALDSPAPACVDESTQVERSVLTVDIVTLQAKVRETLQELLNVHDTANNNAQTRCEQLEQLLSLQQDTGDKALSVADNEICTWKQKLAKVEQVRDLQVAQISVWKSKVAILEEQRGAHIQEIATLKAANEEMKRTYQMRLIPAYVCAIVYILSLLWGSIF